MIVCVREVVYLVLAAVQEGGKPTGVWWVGERFGIRNGTRYLRQLIPHMP